MKQVISYSLWGNAPKYTMGAIHNANLIEKIFPGWIMRIYHNNTVPKNILDELRVNKFVELVYVEENKFSWGGLYWRFYVQDDETVDRYIVRDLDCRLNRSDKACVDEWISSNQPFHLARCVEVHKIEMLGGLWGAIRSKLNINMIEEIEKFHNQIQPNHRGPDQQFLRKIIWPLIKGKCLVHGLDFNYNSGIVKNFPIDSKLGCVFESHVKTWEEGWKKRVMIIQPGAYGDILLCAPIAKIYYDSGYQVYWPTTKKFASLIKRFDYVNHILLDNTVLDKDWLRSDVMKCLNIEHIEYDVILNLADRGPHPTAEKSNENFEQCKYRLSNIPIEHKHTLHWIRNEQKEDELYNQLVGDCKEYIFCHLTSSKNDQAELPDCIKNYKIIQATELEGYSIFDWYKIIINAKQIFCVESSFHQFIDGFCLTIKNIPKYILSRSTLQKGQSYTYSPYWDKKYMN